MGIVLAFLGGEPDGGSMASSAEGGSGPSNSASYDGDSFAIDVLLESWSKSTETEDTLAKETESTLVKETESTSVHKPEAGLEPPANPVAPGGEEAGPSNQPPRVVPYPFQPDEVIGGDCLLGIERRLLAEYSSPPYEAIQMARIQAEDLFEVKVDIIRLMAVLDPMGDWMGRGAEALENPRTSTGEYSLPYLYSILDSLKEEGAESKHFPKLQRRRLPRVDADEHSVL